VALKPARLQWSENGDLESLDYGDVYFQRGAGFAESDYVFLRHNNIPARFAALGAQSFGIAELGFGTGMNFLLTAARFLEHAPPDAQLVYASIEKHPIPAEMLAQIYAQFTAQLPEAAPICGEIIAQYPPMIEGFHTLLLAGGRIQLMLCFGDVADVLPQISGQFDAWYLDGFSPAKNPDMWQETLFPLIAARTKSGGTLATFSVTGHMRRALKALGFDVQKVKGFGIKWSMTAAQKTGIPTPVSAKKHIAVLGAGVAGCGAAHALARRGHAVTLIDARDGIAQETSGNPIGILYPKITAEPSAMGALHAHGFCYTRMLCAALPVASWRASGVLHIDKDSDETLRHQKQVENNELPAEYAFHDADGLHQPMAGYLSPPDLCAALVSSLRVTRLLGRQAQTLSHDGTAWHVKDAAGNDICTADAVIIALGNHSAAMTGAEWLPLQSLRGQITYIRPTPRSAEMAEVICHDGYVAPPVGGLQYIGATFQKEPVSTPDIRSEDHAENVHKLNKFLPQLGITMDDVAGGRTGYRATTPDKLPMAGAAPDMAALLENFADVRAGADTAGRDIPALPNLYISTGYGAHGLSGAPLCGEMIAAMISEEPLPVPAALAEALIPARFLLRDLKRKKI